MKIYSWDSMMNEAGNPYMVKGKEYWVDGRLSYNSPEKVAEFIRLSLKLQNYADEHLYLLCFDAANHIIGVAEISHGTVNNAVVSPREVFQKALMIGAVKIAITHNHPSGDPMPSKADIETTKKIKNAGELLGVHIVDHIIIGRHCDYYSFLEYNEI